MQQLVELSAAQDIEAGDGTTSVVVLAGSLLGAAEKMLGKGTRIQLQPFDQVREGRFTHPLLLPPLPSFAGIHPTLIAESFQRASSKAVEILTEMSTPVDLNDRETLLRAASTSLNSKVRLPFQSQRKRSTLILGAKFYQQIVSQYSSVLAPIAVSSVLRLVTPTSTNVDLRDIRLVKKVGGTIDDTEMIEGLALHQTAITSAGGPTRMEKAKIGLIQFQLSSPKPDMDNQIVVNDYRQMDKILKEERAYLLNMCKKIKKTGCNVLLIQKSILRDAVNELSLHFLAKLKILVVKDIERDEIEFIAKSTGCKPIADIDAFTEDKLGTAELVDEEEKAGARVVKVTGVKNPGRTVSVVCTGANSLVLEESERSLHDALCVVRCLVKKRCVPLSPCPLFTWSTHFYRD